MFSSHRMPLFLRLRSSNTFILIVVCLSGFTDGFLYAVVVPVLPFSLITESGIPEEDVQKWLSYLLTIFGCTTLITSPFAGWLADQTSSRKWPFLFGLTLQVASTSLFIFSPRVEILMLARAFQGISAAIVYSVGLAILVDTFGLSDIGRISGYFLSSANLGVLISPLIGGFLYAKAGYRSVVIAMVSLVAIDILLRLVMIEKPAAIQWVEEDDENSSLCPEPGLSQPEYGTMNNSSTTEQGAAERDIPVVIRLLLHPGSLANMYVVLVSYIVLSAFDAGLGVFVKEYFNWPSSAAGASFLAIALPSLLAPVAGTLSDKMGPKKVALCGFIVSSVGLFAVGFIDEASYWKVVAFHTFLALIGTGIAFVLPSVASNLTSTADALELAKNGSICSRGAYAQVFALFNFGMAGGTVIGPLWMSSPLFGWDTATTSLGVLALSACVSISVFFGVL